MERIAIKNKGFGSAEDVRVALNGQPAHFFACNFNGLDLTKVDLSNCKFDCGCSLVKTKLGKATNAEFYTTDMTKADLRQADVRWARTENVKATGLRLIGAQLTMDCWFLGGLDCEEADTYRLLFWATLPNSAAKEVIRGRIPDRFKLLLQSQFDLGTKFSLS